MVATDPYPKRSIRDRSLNRQTSGYTYVRIPYIERLVLLTFFTKVYASFAWRCYKPHFCEIYTSVERINRSYKSLIWLNFKTNPRTINQTLLKSIVHKNVCKRTDDRRKSQENKLIVGYCVHKIPQKTDCNIRLIYVCLQARAPQITLHVPSQLLECLSFCTCTLFESSHSCAVCIFSLFIGNLYIYIYIYIYSICIVKADSRLVCIGLYCFTLCCISVFM